MYLCQHQPHAILRVLTVGFLHGWLPTIQRDPHANIEEMRLTGVALFL